MKPTNYTDQNDQSSSSSSANQHKNQHITPSIQSRQQQYYSQQQNNGWSTPTVNNNRASHDYKMQPESPIASVSPPRNHTQPSSSYSPIHSVSPMKRFTMTSPATQPINRSGLTSPSGTRPPPPPEPITPVGPSERPSEPISPHLFSVQGRHRPGTRGYRDATGPTAALSQGAVSDSGATRHNTNNNNKDHDISSTAPSQSPSSSSAGGGGATQPESASNQRHSQRQRLLAIRNAYLAESVSPPSEIIHDMPIDHYETIVPKYARHLYTNEEPSDEALSALSRLYPFYPSRNPHDATHSYDSHHYFPQCASVIHIVLDMIRIYGYFDMSHFESYIHDYQQHYTPDNQTNYYLLYPIDTLSFDPGPLLFLSTKLPPLDNVISLPRKSPIPPKRPDAPRITLALDLDETLAHCSVEPNDHAQFTLPIVFRGSECLVNVNLRPHLDYFLSQVSQWFEVIVFTASQKLYAESLLNILDPCNAYISHRVFRDSCVSLDQHHYIKDLTLLGRPLQHIILVDNTLQAAGFQLSNGVPIDSWFHRQDDNELLSLLPFLQALQHVDDVRPYIRDQFGLDTVVTKLKQQYGRQ